MSVTRKYIQEQWRDFEHKILSPINPSKVQRKEMRRAFYAGAWSMFNTVIDDLPEDENDMSFFDNIKAEIIEWNNKLLRNEV